MSAISPLKDEYDDGQYQYDTELAASMRQMAKTLKHLSRNVADALDTGADRIDALALLAITPPPEEQPASTPDQTLNR